MTERGYNCTRRAPVAVLVAEILFGAAKGEGHHVQDDPSRFRVEAPDGAVHGWSRPNDVSAKHTRNDGVVPEGAIPLLVNPCVPAPIFSPPKYASSLYFPSKLFGSFGLSSALSTPKLNTAKSSTSVSAWFHHALHESPIACHSLVQMTQPRCSNTKVTAHLVVALEHFHAALLCQVAVFSLWQVAR